MVSLLISLELALAQMLILHHLAVTPFPLLVLVLILALVLVQLAQATVVAAAIPALAPIGSILVLLRAWALLSAAPPL